MSARRGAWLAGGILLVVYIATLAPDVTFWDAGEFIASAHALGIPHPPGTPLFVLALNAWSRLLPFVPFAFATNVFSAVCTATAAILTARLIGSGPRHERGRSEAWYALAGALCAGGMSTARLNATETEVYAASLALVALTLAVAHEAGRRGSARWRALTAYLIVLAVPLHLSALVAAPAAVYLAASDGDGRVDWRAALALGGVFVLAIGAGKVSIPIAAAGALLIIASPMADRMWRSIKGRTPSPVALAILAVLAVSPLLFMLLRARHDPHVNQGNPATIASLAAVVARTQYDVPPMWPRGAPLWIQIGNLFEYADWQVALSLGPTVLPTVARTAATIFFAVLGVFGAVEHRRADRRAWRAVLTLLACGTIGVVVYLNLRASPSFGWGYLPAGVQREARERDYFFVLGFWAWGLWAGYGAVTVVQRFRLQPWFGALIAALPVALNWTAVTRRTEPDASLPRVLAQALLESAPPRAVLFVDGDNDTYPLWYVQEVDSLRRDVTVVTVPLLGAEWYAAELSRRYDLVPYSASATGVRRYAAAPPGLAERAREQGRPVTAAMSLDPRTRNRLAPMWTVTGMTYVADNGATDGANPSLLATDVSTILVDTALTRVQASRIESKLQGRHPKPSTDSIEEYVRGLLECPRLFLLASPDRARADSLASTCNRR